VEALKKRLHFRGIYATLSGSALKTLLFVTILTYVLEGHDVSADKVFFTSAVYQALTQMWLYLIPSSITGIGEMDVSLSRITVIFLRATFDYEECYLVI